MDKATFWISCLALLISVIALLHTWIKGREQSRLSLEQKRYDLRLDIYSVTDRLQEIARNMANFVLSLSGGEIATRLGVEQLKKDVDVADQIDISNWKETKILTNLSDAVQGLIDIRQNVREMNPRPLFLNTTQLETEFWKARANINEMMQVVEKAEEAWRNRRVDELDEAVRAIHGRVWEGTRKPPKIIDPDDPAISRLSDAGVDGGFGGAEIRFRETPNGTPVEE